MLSSQHAPKKTSSNLPQKRRPTNRPRHKTGLSYADMIARLDTSTSVANPEAAKIPGPSAVRSYADQMSTPATAAAVVESPSSVAPTQEIEVEKIAAAISYADVMAITYPIKPAITVKLPPSPNSKTEKSTKSSLTASKWAPSPSTPSSPSSSALLTVPERGLSADTGLCSAPPSPAVSTAAHTTTTSENTNTTATPSSATSTSSESVLFAPVEKRTNEKFGHWRNIKGDPEKLARLNQPAKKPLESRWAC